MGGMLARVPTFAFQGIDTVLVETQVQIAPGLPTFAVVGLPDKAVAESRERVRAALTSMGLALPPKRILVNLAPADLGKEGSHFDLPIALGLLAAMDVIPRVQAEAYAALGELGLDGRLAPVAGVLPAAIGAASRGLGLVCPAQQGAEAAWSGHAPILPAKSLLQLVAHFRGDTAIPGPTRSTLSPTPPGPDLADVRGQETAKRALEVAAAGGHNLLLIGPPGAGKSMLAARLPGLLPDLTPAEALEVSMIHSVAGLLRDGGLITRPPFREPHHSASQAALVGGGHRAKPGEISLAHRGVLFLDELPEFPRLTLEALRQPLETGRTTVARATAHVTYPARFQLVAAMNPCRCGHLGDPSRECAKAPACGDEYRSRLSGPLLDRIDLFVEVLPVAPQELTRVRAGEASSTVAARVAEARARQRHRFGANGPRSNAEADGAVLRDTLAAASDALSFVESAAQRLSLSARGFARILRVARTLADLAGSETIRRVHVAEALAWRSHSARQAA